jgi:hypothetical protein
MALPDEPHFYSQPSLSVHFRTWLDLQLCPARSDTRQAQVGTLKKGSPGQAQLNYS